VAASRLHDEARIWLAGVDLGGGALGPHGAEQVAALKEKCTLVRR
jgi:hypothetical protein